MELPLYVSLSDAHASFDHVDDKVAELLALLNDVDIHGTDGVGVHMIVDIVDVLCAELIAEVVDFVLDVERTCGIVFGLVSDEHVVHLREGEVDKFHHLVEVFILLLGEVLLATDASVDSSGYVVAAVAYTFQFGYFAEHGSYLGF